MRGVYIKGMTMPTSCSDCKAFICYRQYAGDYGDCFDLQEEDVVVKVEPTRKLIAEVSQMARKAIHVN